MMQLGVGLTEGAGGGGRAMGGRVQNEYLSFLAPRTEQPSPIIPFLRAKSNKMAAAHQRPEDMNMSVVSSALAIKSFPDEFQGE